MKVEEPPANAIVLEGQYWEVYASLFDAFNAGLYGGIIGPVGVGKTAICQKVAQDLKMKFYWVTFSDLIRPSTLIGAFDPTLVFKYGYCPESFIPGPFTLACLEGAIFLANELNRGDEYVLNTLLDAMEERRLYIPQLRTWIKVDENFFFIAAMNPSEVKGTRGLPQAIKDRIKVWCRLTYPDEETEKKIIQSKCPETQLNSEALDRIVRLVRWCRSNGLVERPPSIRAGIGMAKLLVARMQRDEIAEPTPQLMMEVAKLVLPESLDALPGRNSLDVVRDGCKVVLGMGD